MSLNPDPGLPRFLAVPPAPAPGPAPATQLRIYPRGIAPGPVAGGPAYDRTQPWPTPLTIIDASPPAPASPEAPVLAIFKAPPPRLVAEAQAPLGGLTIFRAPPPRILGAEARPAPRLVPETGTDRAAIRGRQPLGDLLVEAGELAAADLARALDLMEREEARFGDILLAHDMVSRDALYRGLARQFGCAVADLAAEPPDTRLVDELGAETCIRHGIVPWKRVGGATVVICSRPAEFSELRRWLPASFGRVHLAVAPEADIQAALVAARRRALTGRAETRVAADESCRDWRTGATFRYGIAAVAATVAVMLTMPLVAFSLLTGWAVLTLLVNTALKAGAAVLFRRRLRAERLAGTAATQTPVAGGTPAPLRLPTVSLLVPLFHERAIAERLVKRLEAIDYPRELLDILLVVEADDALTQTTLANANLPRWMRQIIVPGGAVRTKPRALNFALDFSRGSIVGVYDAEDAPEPSQIRRVVQRFAERGPSTACLQGVLDFYNASENWLARAFAIEYATWFRIMLPGLEKMGFAVPLGGTTLFFRRAALEELGGWDAHNVTEDADLGIRLARHGYRTELIDTVTKEEANCRPWPWVKQRSRWIKGYAMTWGVHMRAPERLLGEVGWKKFLGVQFLFLGTLSQFLLAPVLWSFWLLAFGLTHPLEAALPSWAFWTLGGIFFFSEILTIAVGMMAVADREHRFLLKWVPTLHVYWPLASVAALKAMIEIVTKPFYWDKTQHGHLHRDHDIWGVNRPFQRWRNRA